MLNNILNTIINFCSNLNKFINSNLKIIKTSFIIFIIVIIILSNFNFFFINNFFNVNLNKFESFFFLILNGSVFYIIWFLSFFKNLIVFLPFYFINFFFNLEFSSQIYNFFLNSSYIFKKNDYNNIIYFYDFYLSFLEIKYYEFKNFFKTESNFFKVISLNSNLPIFFYFGFLFFLTTISSLIFLSYFGLYGSFFINLISITLFWFSSLMYFNAFYIDNCFYKFSLGKWFIISVNFTVNFDFLIDSISYSFMFLTLTIAVFVYIYAFSYFRYEPNVERLILLINCFVLSMIILVTCGNFFVLFLGWELIGLTSFFLINFWSTRISTLKAAFKAFTFNKFSDVSLLIAIFLIFLCINDLNILTFNNQISFFNNYYFNIINYNFSIIELISFFFNILCFC